MDLPSTSSSSPEANAPQSKNKPKYHLELLPFEQDLMLDTFDDDLLIVTAR